MAPRKSSASPASSKAKSVPSPPLKQGTLGFASTKRAASTNSLAKGKVARPAPKRARSSTAEERFQDIIEIGDSDVELEPLSSESDIAEEDVGRMKATRPTRTSTADEQRVQKRRRIGTTEVFGSRDGAENAEGRRGALGKKANGGEEVAEVTRKERLDPADSRWISHYGEVRELMGNLEPVHGKGQTMIDHILRVFDLSYDYGPCIGVTRLERWERAEALGLKPPSEVRDILLTIEGGENPRYSECVFFGEV